MRSASSLLCGWPLRITCLTALLLTVYLVIFYHSSLGLHRKMVHGEAIQTHIKPPLDAHALDYRIAHLKEIAEWQKPEGMKVIGLVFYGRRRYVSVLQCYLQRNLVENGGILDEIVFLAKTDDKDDLAYLDQLLVSNPKYSAEYHNQGGFDYSQMWGVCKKGNMYVKIDDDVLFIEDSTIRSIVKQKVEHPEYMIVSANLVVQFSFAWIHLHLGAIHPYLPELTPLKGKKPTTSWRKSELPYWNGPEDFDVTNFTSAKRHRWLPLAPGTGKLDHTPITSTLYGDPDPNPGHSDWQVGVQQHYSFLENLEKDELWRYAFDTWDVKYDRLSINLIAITGDDVVAMSPMPRDDEELITMKYSKQKGRHVVVDGHGVAVHNGYWVMASGDDKPGIDTTDVLDRYRAYAAENICVK